MTAQYTKIGNTVGWFDKTTNTWIGEIFVEVNLASFILSLSFDLQDELVEFIKINRLLEIILNSGKLSKTSITKLKDRIIYDFDNKLFSEELKNAMLISIEGLASRI